MPFWTCFLATSEYPCLDLFDICKYGGITELGYLHNYKYYLESCVLVFLSIPNLLVFCAEKRTKFCVFELKYCL